MSHFMAISEGVYDRDTIHGIFNSQPEARDWIENASEDDYAYRAIIQEYEGTKLLTTWERDPLHPMFWKERSW